MARAFAIACAFASAHSGTLADAQGPNNMFIRLQIDGRNLAWPQPARGNLRLTWSFVRAPTATNGAVNCGRMVFPEVAGFDRETLQTEASAAFAYWQKVTAVDFEYSDDVTKADVLIGAQETPQGIAFADVLHRPTGNLLQGEITRGLICLNTSARWKSGFDGDLKSYDLRYVLAHEIGHVLGLDHPSSSGQLMSWRYDERTRDLQRGDIDGATALYGPRLRMDAGRQ